MPAPVRLSRSDEYTVDSYLAAMRAVGNKTGRSTTLAARTCQSRVSRAGGWDGLDPDQRIEIVGKARSFASWLMVTGQLRADADRISSLNLHLGYAARSHCPEDYRWFSTACARVDVDGTRIGTQWNVLAKTTAMTATAPAAVRDTEFFPAREALLESYQCRGLPQVGRNFAGAFNQLQLTLFHAEHLTTWRRPSTHQPVAATGLATITLGYAATALRYIEQVTLSLRPNTVTHIEHDLRRFGTWLTDSHPDVANCSELQRIHIEPFKTWLTRTPTPRTGSKSAGGRCPDARGYRALTTTRSVGDRWSMRSELLGQTVGHVAQIGTAYWLRIPLGKTHNDRYIPLHPQLKELLDWIDNHRPAGIRTGRLLVENHRPITSH